MLADNIVSACYINDATIHLVEGMPKKDTFVRSVCGCGGLVQPAEFDNSCVPPKGLCQVCGEWLADWKIVDQTLRRLFLVKVGLRINSNEWNWSVDDMSDQLIAKHAQITPRIGQLWENNLVRAVRIGAKIHLCERSTRTDATMVCGRKGVAHSTAFDWDDLCQDCYNWLELYGWVVNDVTDSTLELSRDAGLANRCEPQGNGNGRRLYEREREDDTLCVLHGRGPRDSSARRASQQRSNGLQNKG